MKDTVVREVCCGCCVKRLSCVEEIRCCGDFVVEKSVVEESVISEVKIVG